MNKFARMLSLAALMLVPTLSALAGSTKLGDSGLQFEAPAGWKVDGDAASGPVTVSNADGTISLVISVQEGESWEEAMKGLAEVVDESLNDVKTNGEAQQNELNGIKVVNLDGTGKTEEGNQMAWSIMVFAGAKPVVSLVIAGQDQLTAEMDTLSKFFASFKKV